MEKIDIVSSILKSAYYDNNYNMLSVTFKNGKEYVFYNVPNDVWNNFKNSESKGSYFSRYIKGKYVKKFQW
mgnify:FL=1